MVDYEELEETRPLRVIAAPAAFLFYYFRGLFTSQPLPARHLIFRGRPQLETRRNFSFFNPLRYISLETSPVSLCPPDFSQLLLLFTSPSRYRRVVDEQAPDVYPNSYFHGKRSELRDLSESSFYRRRIFKTSLSVRVFLRILYLVY